MVHAEWMTKARNARTAETRQKYLRRARRDRLADDIKSCRECPLNRARTHAVPLYGPYEGAEIVLVGEAPGAEEDREGRPFVGRAGQLLRRIITAVGGDPKRVIYMNVLACRPPRNRDPLIAETVACRPLFDRQLETAGTLVGVTTGSFALRSVWPNAPAIGTALNKPFWKDGRLWVPTYHPAYVLRNPLKRDVIETGIKLALDYARGEMLPKPNVGDIGDKNIDVALGEHGWTMMHLRILGEQIVILDHAGAKIPPAVQHLPQYTIEELLRLGIVGAATMGTKRQIRGVHETKMGLNGKVIA